MTRVLIVWALPFAIGAGHIARCVAGEARDRRRELREHRIDARPGLRLVPRDELQDRRDRRDRMGAA